MKNYILKIVAAIIFLFGLQTLYLSSSIILDLFDIRAQQGNYVLFVVWTNLIISIIYLFAAYGFIKKKKWATPLLSIALSILIVCFISLAIYANSGGIHETKTFYALIFRTSITMAFTAFSYFLITKKEH
ncbi:MAG: hypothetical protein GQ527_10980 [Bacteroidales bacterium]|nr:hypothetical protein [Bacteroidales bacterium]